MTGHQTEFRRTLIVMTYTAVIALVILLLPAGFTTPLRMVFTDMTGGLQGALYTAGGEALAATGTLRDAMIDQEKGRIARRELRRLGNENVRLREQLLMQKRRVAEYKRLRSGMPEFTALAVAVTSYDSRSMRNSVVVNAGSSKGIAEGQAVTWGGALVGVIAETGRWHSRVRLITDAGSRVPCRVQRTRDICIVKGSGGDSCGVEWVGRSVKIKRGDILITSPLEEEVSDRPGMPSGLPVATISQIRPGRLQPLFRDVTAVPRVDVGRLEMVQVLIPEVATEEE